MFLGYAPPPRFTLPPPQHRRHAATNVALLRCCHRAAAVALCAAVAPPPSYRQRRAVTLPPPPQPSRCCDRAAAVALCAAAALRAAATAPDAAADARPRFDGLAIVPASQHRGVAVAALRPCGVFARGGGEIMAYENGLLIPM